MGEVKKDSAYYGKLTNKQNRTNCKSLYFTDLQIPVSSGLAANIRDRQMAEQQEQEEVKRLVLNYNQRQEEEIYNGMCLPKYSKDL